jgi:hypothetical protein
MRVSFKIDAVEPHETSMSKRKFGASIYLTKNPPDIDRIRPRLKLDPRLSVICMIRDPRDVIVSFHGKYLNRYFVSLQEWKLNINHVLKLRDHSRFVLLRYEDFVAHPDECQAIIADRIPYLERTSQFSAFDETVALSRGASKALGGARPINDASVGQWRHHVERVAGQLIQYGPITRELIDLGYEKDDSWLDLLSSTMPDASRSVKERVRRKHPTMRRLSAYSYAFEHFFAYHLRLPYV